MAFCGKECDCYRQYTDCLGKSFGRCLGTKEIEICGCGGDESKCDFYPERRKKLRKPRKPRKPSLSDIIQELMENHFELTICRGFAFEDTTVRVRIRDVKGNRIIERCLRRENNLFLNYEEALLEMIDSIIYDLKGGKHE